MSGHFRSAAKSFLFFALILSLAGCASFDFAGRGPSAPAHHGLKSFVNIPPKPAFTIWAQLRCLIGLEEPDPPAIDPALLPAVFKPEIMEPDPAAIQVTWIGHSSFLFQVDGLNILTDPVFSRQVSPVSFAGPARLALLPIGHYGPHRLVKPVHVDPAEAVRAHLDLEAELSIAMHRGTFPMSPAPPSEPLAEPPAYFRVALSEAGLSPGSFRLLKIGQTLALK